MYEGIKRAGALRPRPGSLLWSNRCLALAKLTYSGFLLLHALPQAERDYRACVCDVPVKGRCALGESGTDKGRDVQNMGQVVIGLLVILLLIFILLQLLD